MPDNDDLLRLRVHDVVVGADLRLAENRGRQRVHRMIRGGCGRLSDGRHVLEALDGPGLVARDDKGVAAEIHRDLPVVLRARPGRAAQGPVGRCLRQLLTDERGIQLHIDVHLQPRGERLRHLRDVPAGDDVGGLGVAAEDPQLVDGLAGPGVLHAAGPVGADHREWGMRIMGLHHGGEAVGDGRPRRHHHADVPLLHAGDTEGEESGAALVVTHVHPDVRAGQERQAQRGVPRTRAHHHIADVAGELLHDGPGQLHRLIVHADESTERAASREDR